jgi:hypothetical protein
MALSGKKKILFAVAAIGLSVAGVVFILLAADLALHYRAERSAGLNRYGYRGPVVGAKEPGELRIVMLGGSTVFGYGVAWNESIPVFLEARLRQKLNRPVRVVNLGFNNEGVHAFVPNLEDFEYLDYDVIVLYEGYNDLMGDGGMNRAVYRRDSAIYRTIGYYPILPLYLEEKALSLRYGNDLNVAYDAARRQERGDASTVVFRPDLAQRGSATALEALAAMTKALDGKLANTAAAAAQPIREDESRLGCRSPFVTYCEAVAAAIRFGLDRGKGVVVGSQPRLPGSHAEGVHTLQQEMLSAMLARNFGADKRVVHANFIDLLDLKSVEVTFDAMHLKPPANAAVADALVEPVLAAATGAGIHQ